MQFHDVNEKCKATNVALTPFTDMKTRQVDIMAVARAGNFIRFGSVENAFPRIANPQKRDRDDEKEENEEEKKKDSSDSEMRVFLASAHLKLHCSSPSNSYVRTMDMCDGDVVFTTVGSSSYSMCTNMFFKPKAGDNAASPIPMGSDQVTFVRIDPETRKPKPLDDELRAAAVSYVNEERNAAEGFPGKMDRLVPPAKIQAALKEGPSALGSVLVCAPAQTAVRYSDTDYNGHTNQLTYIQLAVDHLRCYLESDKVLNPTNDKQAEGAATTTAETMTSKVVAHPGNKTDIAEVRIDYLAEIRDVDTKIQVLLMHEDGSFNPDGTGISTDTRKKFWFAVTAGPKLATLGYLIRQ